MAYAVPFDERSRIAFWRIWPGGTFLETHRNAGERLELRRERDQRVEVARRNDRHVDLLAFGLAPVHLGALVGAEVVLRVRVARIHGAPASAGAASPAARMRRRARDTGFAFMIFPPPVKLAL